MTGPLIPTRTAFLAVYQAKIQAAFAWAKDPVKLSMFMLEVEQTLKPNAPATWNWDGELAKETRRELGGKGPHTLKALQAMPEGKP